MISAAWCMKADVVQKNEKIEKIQQKFSRLLLACRGRCVSEQQQGAGASFCTYLCVTVRGTMALSQVYGALFSPHSPKQLHLFLLSAISSSSHCIHLSVLFFKCSYSPFRRQITFKPTVTMATFACEKVHLRGPTKCATTCIGILLH